MERRVVYKFAFIMDPLEGVLVDKDTTFAFMLEAQKRGHPVYFLRLRDLYADGRQVRMHAWRCKVERATPHFRFLDKGADYPIETFDAVFMRKDPPADAPYLYATMLLSLADPRRTFLLNDPAGLREANEKLYALNFPSVIPPTVVTYQIARLRKFMIDQGGEMIVKPLDGHGGEGVFFVHSGDRRLIVLNGEPLGCTLRVPRDDEHRGNIHVGGTCVKAPVTARDREICKIGRAHV